MDYWWWLILGIALMAMEIVAPGFIILWFGIGAVLVGLIVWAAPGLPVAVQLLIFAGASLVGLFGARRFLKKTADQDSDQPGLNDWKSKMVGQIVVLIDPIVNGAGTAKVGDSTWRVRGEDMPAGTRVKVVSIDGAILQVEALDS